MGDSERPKIWRHSTVANFAGFRKKKYNSNFVSHSDLRKSISKKDRYVRTDSPGPMFGNSKRRGQAEIYDASALVEGYDFQLQLESIWKKFVEKELIRFTESKGFVPGVEESPPEKKNIFPNGDLSMNMEDDSSSSFPSSANDPSSTLRLHPRHPPPNKILKKSSAFESRLRKKHSKFRNFLKTNLAKELFGYTFLYISSLLKIEKLKLRIQVSQEEVSKRNHQIRRKSPQSSTEKKRKPHQSSSSFIQEEEQDHDYIKYRLLEDEKLKYLSIIKESREKLKKERETCLSLLRQCSGYYCLLITRMKFPSSVHEFEFFEIFNFFLVRIVVSKIEAKHLHGFIEMEIMRLYRLSFFPSLTEKKELEKRTAAATTKGIHKRKNHHKRRRKRIFQKEEEEEEEELSLMSEEEEEEEEEEEKLEEEDGQNNKEENDSKEGGKEQGKASSKKNNKKGKKKNPLSSKQQHSSINNKRRTKRKRKREERGEEEGEFLSLREFHFQLMKDKRNQKKQLLALQQSIERDQKYKKTVRKKDRILEYQQKRIEELGTFQRLKKGDFLSRGKVRKDIRGCGNRLRGKKPELKRGFMNDRSPLISMLFPRKEDEKFSIVNPFMEKIIQKQHKRIEEENKPSNLVFHIPTKTLVSIFRENERKKVERKKKNQEKKSGGGEKKKKRKTSSLKGMVNLRSNMKRKISETRGKGNDLGSSKRISVSSSSPTSSNNGTGTRFVKSAYSKKRKRTNFY